MVTRVVYCFGKIFSKFGYSPSISLVYTSVFPIKNPSCDSSTFLKNILSSFFSSCPMRTTSNSAREGMMTSVSSPKETDTFFNDNRYPSVATINTPSFVFFIFIPVNTGLPSSIAAANNTSSKEETSVVFGTSISFPFVISGSGGNSSRATQGIVAS